MRDLIGPGSSFISPKLSAWGPSPISKQPQVLRTDAPAVWSSGQVPANFVTAQVGTCREIGMKPQADIPSQNKLEVVNIDLC